MILIVALSLLAFIWIVLAIGPWHSATFRTRLDAETPLAFGGDFPSITIVIPARNEAEMLLATVPSFCEQDYPNLQVVMVDDQSDDQSPEILKSLSEKYANLKVIRAEDRPEGWCGKPWAVQQGVKNVSTDLILFGDADCVFQQAAARQAAAYLIKNNLDMVSLFPTVIFGSTSEELGMGGLISVLTMLMPLRLANDPKSKIALAAGGFILVRRSMYDKIGGHESVKAEIIEDINLAKKFKQAGAKTYSCFTDLVSTRMYNGFSDMWEGLAKNAYAGMEYQPLKFWAGISIAIIVIVLPPIYFLASIVAAMFLIPHAITFLLLSAVIVTSQMLIQWRAVRYLKLPAWQVIAMPISAGLYAMIAIDSAFQHHFRGGNLWKGRRYGRQMLINNDDPVSDISPKAE